MQSSFEMFNYPAHPPEIGKIILQLLQHLDEIKTGQPGDSFSIEVTQNQFLLYDRNTEIRYVTPDGELVNKIGTKVVPIRHYSLIYLSDRFMPGTSEDLAGNVEERVAWVPWNLSANGDVTYTKSVKSSRPGVLIHDAWHRVDGCRVREIVSLSAYETEYNRDPFKWNEPARRYDTRKGWVDDPDILGRVIEVRRPGDMKGYHILEEMGAC